MKKYSIEDFLSYAEGFDYTQDINEGNITGYKTDQEIKEDMKKWKLKDFHIHFGFKYKDDRTGEEK